MAQRCIVVNFARTVLQASLTRNGLRTARWAVVAAALWPAAAMAEEPVPAMVATVQLPWLAPDGTAYTVGVPLPDLTEFLANRSVALAEEERQLSAGAGDQMRAEGGVVLNRILARVPAYADWVYGWVDSYVAAFRVIGRGVHAWSQSSPGSPQAELMAALSQAMSEIGSAEFERRVLLPAQPAANLETADRRAQSTLASEWQRVLARDRMRWLTLLSAHASAARRAEWPTTRSATACTAKLVAGDVRAFDSGDVAAKAAAAQQDLFALRVTRPFATRLGAIAARLVVGGLSATGVSVAGIGGATTAGGVALSFVATSGVVWSIDYGLNWLDAELHRDMLIGAIGSAVATAMGAQQDDMIKARRDDLRASFVSLAQCADRFRLQVAAH